MLFFGIEKTVAKGLENKTAGIGLCRENFWWEKGNGNILKSRMAWYRQVSIQPFDSFFIFCFPVGSHQKEIGIKQLCY